MGKVIPFDINKIDPWDDFYEDIKDRLGYTIEQLELVKKPSKARDWKFSSGDTGKVIRILPESTEGAG